MATPTTPCEIGEFSQQRGRNIRAFSRKRTDGRRKLREALGMIEEVIIEEPLLHMTPSFFHVKVHDSQSGNK